MDATPDPKRLAGGVARLRAQGFTLLEHSTRPSDADSIEIALLRDDEDFEWSDDDAVSFCQQVFDAPAALGVTTFVSRGTDDDARSVLARFDLVGDVRRAVIEGSDVVTVTVPRAEMRRVPESRLHTALEAALNAEVQIVLTD
ncbi:hypothetical protein JOD63_003413 [Microbacterium terrae]|uniref:hypothetical protein n=1 Tax=Microbacterium terrae TaxID=69369 RepID=UPI0012ECDF93|nr:hypothetical protein [Microbacterium terrae]MBP1079445.1 hypothetical protein [Microbacterium terrae]